MNTVLGSRKAAGEDDCSDFCERPTLPNISPGRRAIVDDTNHVAPAKLASLSAAWQLQVSETTAARRVGRVRNNKNAFSQSQILKYAAFLTYFK